MRGAGAFYKECGDCGFDETGRVVLDKGEMTEELNLLINRTVKKVTEDIETFNFNTAISALMIFVNTLYRKKIRNHKALKILAQLIQPFAPHIAEEMWEALGEKGFVSLSPWPSFTTEELKEKETRIGVQVNGKIRGAISCKNTDNETIVLKLAKAEVPIQNKLKGKKN